MRTNPEMRRSLALAPDNGEGAFNNDHEIMGLDDSNEIDEDDDWGVVSTEDLPVEHVDRSNQLFQTGVLIISGSDDEGDDAQPYIGRIPKEVYPNTSTDLSLPGTLSIPTDPGTLIDDEANEIIRRAKERRLIHSNSDIRRKPGFPERPGRFVKPFLMVAVAVVLTWTCMTVYLVRELNRWRSVSIALQQEIREIKELQEKMAKRNVMKPPVPPQRFSWEDSSCQSMSNEEMTLFDNCWVRAKAHVKFGDCAAEAQQTIKDWSVTLVETADALSKAVWNTAAYTWKDFSNSTNATESDEGGSSQSSYSSQRMTPKHLKGYFDTVSLQVRKAANNLKSLGPLFDQTATAAMKGLDEAARAAVAAGATAGEAVVVASEMATEMMEDFVEVAREVMEDATRTARLRRDR